MRRTSCITFESIVNVSPMTSGPEVAGLEAVFCAWAADPAQMRRAVAVRYNRIPAT
jgi:hypothetical protein